MPVAQGPARRSNAALLAVLLAGASYHLAIVWKTSFTVAGERVFSLFDDAMISMRYARNLAAGNGLVWNAGGERVEGFTNPLWTGLMALVHLSPLPPHLASLPIQLLGVALLAALALVTRRLVLRLGGTERAGILATVLTLFYFPLANWTLQGMEVGLLALLVTLALLWSLEDVAEAKAPWRVLLLLAAGTWLRMDAAVPFVTIAGPHAAVTMGAASFGAAASREARGRRLLAAGATLSVCLGLQTLARLWYFGDPLPNTYYLKLTGFPLDLRVLRGLLVAGDLVLPLLPLVAVTAVALRGRWRESAFVSVVVLLLGQLAYSVWVGGDAWEEWGGANRYVCLAVPAAFALLALALDRLASWWRPALVAPALLAAALFLLHAGRGRESLRPWLLASRPPLVVLNSGVVALAHDLARLTAPDATLAVWWAGAIPYFADRSSLDLLGKCDREIARLPMHVPDDRPRARAFYPGHLKWDLDRTVRLGRPDVIWSGGVPREPGVFSDYVEVRIRKTPVHLLRGSPRVRWDLLPEAPAGFGGASADRPRGGPPGG